MAISFVSNTAVTSGGTLDGGSGANRVMIFHAGTAVGSDSISAVTWNGESFTKLTSKQGPGGNRYSSLWYLIPTGTGSQTITITGTHANPEVDIYSGANTVGNATNTSGNGTSASLSVTSSATGWIVGGCIADSSSVTAGSNTTVRTGGSSSIVIADSNGVSSPTAINFSFSSSDYQVTGASISYTPVNYTVTADVGAFVLTGIATTFSYGRTLVANVGSFVLTGMDVTLTLFRKWINDTLNSSSHTNATKNSSSWSNSSKNSSSMSNQTKNSSSYSNQSKNSSTFTNQTKN